MSAKVGWRIHVEGKDIQASFWTIEGADVVTVKGFLSRIEAYMFIATHIVLLSMSHGTEASAMIREFASRVRH